MKLKSLLLLIGACLVFAGQSYGQDKQKEKIIIIKTDGNEKKPKEKIIIKKKGEGEEDMVIMIDGEEAFIKGLDEDVKWVEKEVEEAMEELEIEMDELDGEKHFHFRFKDESGEEQVIDWSGTGDLPEDIKKQLEENDIRLIELESSMEGEQEVEIKVVVEKDGKGKKKKKKIKKKKAY
jgi:hypothetical protein